MHFICIKDSNYRFFIAYICIVNELWPCVKMFTCSKEVDIFIICTDYLFIFQKLQCYILTKMGIISYCFIFKQVSFKDMLYNGVAYIFLSLNPSIQSFPLFHLYHRWLYDGWFLTILSTNGDLSFIDCIFAEL